MLQVVGAVLVSQGATASHHDSVVCVDRNVFPIVQGVRNPNARRWQGLSGGCEDPPHPSPGSPACWLFLACRHVVPISASVCMLLFFCVSSPLCSKAACLPEPSMISSRHLLLVYNSKDLLFQIRSLVQVPGGHLFWG